MPNAKNLSQIKSPYNINVSAIPEYVNRPYRGLKSQSSPALSLVARLTFQARLDFWRQPGRVVRTPDLNSGPVTGSSPALTT